MHYFDKPIHAKTVADLKWRADEFKYLRAELKKTGLKVRDIYPIMEISHKTYKQMPCISEKKVPTLYALERLRHVLNKRNSEYLKNNTCKIPNVD